jgi:hypothetical protein
MNTLADGTRQAELDRELLLVDSAIALVRRGVARTVTIVNLPLCTTVLELAQAKARAHKLRVTAAVSGDGSPCSLVVDCEEDPLDPPARPQLSGASRTR